MKDFVVDAIYIVTPAPAIDSLCEMSAPKICDICCDSDFGCWDPRTIICAPNAAQCRCNETPNTTQSFTTLPLLVVLPYIHYAFAPTVRI